eukprot:Stramenopile-MAST_4_protein_2829
MSTFTSTSTSDKRLRQLLDESVKTTENAVLTSDMCQLFKNLIDYAGRNKDDPALSASLPSLHRLVTTFSEGDDVGTRLSKMILGTTGVESPEVETPGRRKRDATGDGIKATEEAASMNRLGVNDSFTEAARPYLENIASWDFNIFQFERLFDGNKPLTLQVLGHACFEYFSLFKALNLDEKVVHRYFFVVGKDYQHVPYHNALHGADVMQTLCATIALSPKLRKSLSNESIFAALISAAVHDVGHFGRTNAFLNKTSHKLSMVYNDQATLENYHVARAFELAQQTGCTIFESFQDMKERSKIRKTIIHCVLHTDMGKHKDSLEKVKADTERGPGIDVSDHAQHVRCLGLLLHCCDISNPGKEWSIYCEWTDKVMQEFNEEYDEETALGLPHGFFNPSTPLPQFQKGFLGFVVNPLFQAMNDIDGIELSKPLAYIDANIKAWEMEISEGLKAD